MSRNADTSRLAALPPRPAGVPRRTNAVVELERLADASEVLAGHSATIAELAAGLKRDGVIASELVTLRQDPSQATGWGQVEIYDNVTHASVAIVNLGTCRILAHNGGAQAHAPKEGRGVIAVPAGGFICLPLAGNMLSLYGRAGEQVFITRFTHLQPPAVGNLPPAHFTVQLAAASVPTSTLVYLAPWNIAPVYAGFTVRETAGVVSSFRFRDGIATGTILDTVSLAPNESRNESLRAQQCATSGIFLEWLAGTVDLSLLVR